jgi:hypothetical protein
MQLQFVSLKGKSLTWKKATTHLRCHDATQLIDVPQQLVFSSEKPGTKREIYRGLDLTNRPRENKMSIGIVGEEESLITLASFQNLIFHFIFV